MDSNVRAVSPEGVQSIEYVTSMFFDVKAFIFDLDGTIIDSFPSGCRKMALAAKRYRLRFTDKHRERLRRIWGKPVITLIRTLWPRAKPEKLELVKDLFYSIDDRHDIELIPGARETIEYLHSVGYVLTILTSRELDTTMILLERHDLVQYFTHIACKDTVKAHKPHPDALACTKEKLAELGIGLHQCIGCGDAPEDHGVGVSAGLLLTIIVKTGPLGIPDHPDMPDMHPDHHVDSIADVRHWVARQRAA